MARRPESKQSSWLGKATAAVGVAAATVFAAWWFSGPDLAAETIALQRQLLRDGENPEVCRYQLRQIMQNIDRLPSQEIRDVRRELGKAIGKLTKQAAERFVQASSAERPTLLDADLGKLQLVMALFDATNQGGMRVRTQADIDRAEAARRRREERAKSASRRPVKKPQRPVDKQPKTPTPTQVYAQALLEHAKKKGVDLGRFSRRLGRG